MVLVVMAAIATAVETMPINISNEMDKYLHTEGAAGNGNVRCASCAVAGWQWCTTVRSHHHSPNTATANCLYYLPRVGDTTWERMLCMQCRSLPVITDIISLPVMLPRKRNSNFSPSILFPFIECSVVCAQCGHHKEWKSCTAIDAAYPLHSFNC